MYNTAFTSLGSILQMGVAKEKSPKPVNEVKNSRGRLLHSRLSTNSKERFDDKSNSYSIMLNQLELMQGIKGTSVQSQSKEEL